MNKPTNRREIFMHAIATGCECPIEPVTREEILLAEHAKREAQGGGSGGGASYRADRETVWEATIQTEYMEDMGYLAMFQEAPFEITEHHQRYIVEFDGVEYVCYSHINPETEEIPQHMLLGGLFFMDLQGVFSCYHALSLIPFIFLSSPTEGMHALQVVTDTEPTSHSIKVTKETIVGTGSGHFVVTLNGNGSGTTLYEIDRSFKEILAVCESGVFPILWHNYTSQMYQLMSYDDRKIMFFHMYMDPGTLDTTVHVSIISIMHYDSIDANNAALKHVT